MPVSTDGIILLSKQSGITSFSSLWQIKNALGTKKIGHTGTLDTFAEGLLVALSGRLTRLVPYITDCSKEYEALVSFGSETDTLDPDGTVIRTEPLPTLESIVTSLDAFRGSIFQRPPSYSAVHVAGQRASDRIRNGEAIELPLRAVTIYAIDILSALTVLGKPAQHTDSVASLFLRISCSKGTYIRSLARDLAHTCASCAHLTALRRTRIGPFLLQDAAGFSMLSTFGSVLPAKFGVGEKPPQAAAEEIRNCVQTFTPELAPVIGLTVVTLNALYINDFLNGKTPQNRWFDGLTEDATTTDTFAVFCDQAFLGAVSWQNNQLAYQFVIGHDS